MSFPILKESFVPKMNFFSFLQGVGGERKGVRRNNKWDKLVACACALVLLERTTLATYSPDLLAMGCRKQCSGGPWAVLQVT